MMLATVAAVAALAAPFGELPFRPVGAGANCLGPTGAPGELARAAPGGVEFLTATAAGLVRSGRASLSDVDGLPSGGRERERRRCGRERRGRRAVAGAA